MLLQVEGSTIGFPSRMVAGLPTEQLPTTPLPPAGGGPGLVVSGGQAPGLLAGRVVGQGSLIYRCGAHS